MLEEPTHDRSDADRLRQPGHLRPEAADPAHREVDPDAGRRRLIERFDRLRVDERIELQRDPTFFPGRHLLADQLDDLRAQRDRCDEQPAVAPLAAVAGQEVEQVRHVIAELLVGRQQAEVLVDAGRVRVVVAGAQMCVPPDARPLPADDQTHLRMGLQAHHAVHDVDPRLLEGPRPGDVGLLVEPGLELDERHHLLAGFSGADQRSDDRGVRRGPIQRLLDRLYVRIVSGRLDEGFDRGRERVVWMVHQDIAALAEDPEDIRRSVLGHEPGGSDGRPRWLLEVGTLERDQPRQGAEIERPLGLIDLFQVQLELPHQERPNLRGHRPFDLETHGHGSPAASRQHELDRREQILRLVLFDLQIGIASHPEHVVGHDLHPWEQAIEVVGDHLFDRHEPLAVGEREEPRKQGRHLEPREAANPRDGVTDQHGEVQGEVRDVGERVRRVDRERREDREDALDEGFGGPASVLVGEILGVHQADPLLLEGGPDLVGERTVDPGRGRQDPNADLGQLLLGTHPVRGRCRDPRLHLIEQPGYADLEELVEALGADRDELQPLEDRSVGIFSECQDTFVEVQPRKLSVEVMGGRIFGGRGKGLHQHTDGTPRPVPPRPSTSVRWTGVAQAFFTTTVSTTFATFSRPSSASSSVSVTSFHFRTSIAL